MRLAILASHPIQYYAPLFAEVARRLDLVVFFVHRATPEQQAAAGFGAAFDWDIDLFGGYESEFLRNVAKDPGVHHFSGCDTPDIGSRLAAGKFDALLVMGWNLKSFVQGIWAAKRQAVPVLVRGDSHLQTPRSGLKRAAKAAIYPGLLRAFDLVLYVGTRNREYYEYYRYPRDRLVFSPHCVDTRRFASGSGSKERKDLRESLGMGPEDKVALFSGKLVDFKRPLDLINAAAIARADGAPLRVMIAGSGPLQEELNARASNLAVPLHMLGFQNQSAMPKAYAAADALVLPSTGQETWGLVCNEALACGVPIVVSSEVGCAPDLASDGQVGRTFPCGDTQGLANALGNLFANAPLPRLIQMVSERFSLATAAEGIIEAAARSKWRSTIVFPSSE